MEGAARIETFDYIGEALGRIGRPAKKAVPALVRIKR